VGLPPQRRARQCVNDLKFASGKLPAMRHFKWTCSGQHMGAYGSSRKSKWTCARRPLLVQGAHSLS